MDFLYGEELNKNGYCRQWVSFLPEPDSRQAACITVAMDWEKYEDKTCDLLVVHTLTRSIEPVFLGGRVPLSMLANYFVGYLRKVSPKMIRRRTKSMVKRAAAHFGHYNHVLTRARPAYKDYRWVEFKTLASYLGPRVKEVMHNEIHGSDGSEPTEHR